MGDVENQKVRVNVHAHAEPVPLNPRLFKIFIASTRTAHDVEPEDYLGAIAELLFLTISLSYCITYFFNHEVLADNPIINMVGYNNPCAFWDTPPALYVAALLFCPMVHFAFRYATLDSARAALTLRNSSTGLGHARCCRIVNYIYAASTIILMGIFVITPRHPKDWPELDKKELDWYMRVHSTCFLQFVPILGITMSGNYFEAYFSGVKEHAPSCMAWLVLVVYLLSTTLEAIFAIYSIFCYEGNYIKGENKFAMNPTTMQIIDYCWFFSLPLAGIFQPAAPNLHYHFELEGAENVRGTPEELLEEEVDGHEHITDDMLVDTDFGSEQRCVYLFCGVAIVVPILMVWLVIVQHVERTKHLAYILGVLTPLIICGVLTSKVSDNAEPNRYPSGCCNCTLNSANFGCGNYISKLMGFLGKAQKRNFREEYAQWFENLTDEDPTVGTQFGGNTKMYLSWNDCVDKLRGMAGLISRGNLKRESELALTVLNNTMWPEAGKFGLGMPNDHHAFVRPFLARLFDNGQGQPDGWTLETLRNEFRILFADLTEIDHNPVSRNGLDILYPAASKTMITVMVLRVLHKVCIGMDITERQAKELAALQTAQLFPAILPARISRAWGFWVFFTGPTRAKAKKWIERYKVALKKKFPNTMFKSRELSLLASAHLDAMLQAGGRSVPLAIDLVAGYMLSSNKPASLEEVNWESPDDIRSVMLEAMRFHPPVTTLPFWVRNGDDAETEWSHELICLDRALADPSIFPEPDEFKFRRENEDSCSMSWAAEANVGGDPAHPDSHGCPGFNLSINMVIAWMLEYKAAEPWTVANEDIKFNFYGSKGWKVSKNE